MDVSNTCSGCTLHNCLNVYKRVGTHTYTSKIGGTWNHRTHHKDMIATIYLNGDSDVMQLDLPYLDKSIRIMPTSLVV